jgi:rhamnogalacturonan endolyase
MLRNSSGFYSYAIFEHLADWPPFNLPQTRIVFQLRKDKYRYYIQLINIYFFLMSLKYLWGFGGCVNLSELVIN